MRQIFKSCNLDTGVPRINCLQSKYMYRMSNPLLMGWIRRYYRRKFAELLQFDPTVKFDDKIRLNTESITVGKYTSLADLYVRGVGEVIIGEHVSFANGVKIITSNHTLSNFKVINFYTTRIEDYAFLALDATILFDLTIGRGAYVGANSVVRNDVPPYAVVFGNPAKVVRFRMKPEEIIEYEKALYPEGERLPLDLLQRNYKDYYTDCIDEIKNFMDSRCL